MRASCSCWVDIRWVKVDGRLVRGYVGGLGENFGEREFRRAFGEGFGVGFAEGSGVGSGEDSVEIVIYFSVREFIEDLYRDWGEYSRQHPPTNDENNSIWKLG